MMIRNIINNMFLNLCVCREAKNIKRKHCITTSEVHMTSPGGVMKQQVNQDYNL